MAGTILIVDDIATNRIVLKVKLADACYETLQCATGQEALRLARAASPDLILLDQMMPDLDGIEVCRRLRANPNTCDIPVVMVTAQDTTEARLAALHAGADEFFGKPLDEKLLLARIRNLMRARETAQELRLRDSTSRALGFGERPTTFDTPGRIALITGCKEQALGWRQALMPHLQDEISVFDRLQAMNDLFGPDGQSQTMPDVIMIAADLCARGDGLRLMTEFRSRHSTRHAAICIAFGQEDRDLAEHALDLGANDLVRPESDPREIALRLGTLKRRKRQADRLRASVHDGLRAALTDPLTGLYNRRYALPHLSRIAEHASKSGKPFAVMVLDIDRFKRVNDTWGHATGDKVLIEVATRLRNNLRAKDLLARIGGEEFLVALPDTSLDMAIRAANRLCAAVKSAPVVTTDGMEIAITLSIGLSVAGGQPVAQADAGGCQLPSILTLIDNADNAMMIAKAEGRNQVTISRTAA